MLPTAREFPGLYGEFGQRLSAVFVDYMLFVLAYGISLAVARDFSSLVQRFAASDYGFELGIVFGGWLYWAGFESSPWQATPGKRAAKLRVTDLEGNRLSFLRATARYFAKLVSAAPMLLGFTLAAMTARRQALHDLIAGTAVVHPAALETLAAVPLDSAGEAQANSAVEWNKLGVALGLSLLAAIVVFSFWVEIMANQSNLARQQTSEAIQLLGGGETGLYEYYQDKQVWPAHLSDVYSMGDTRPAGRYVLEVKLTTCAGDHCGMVATMDPDKAHPRLAGRTVEIWTLDGGLNWLCGPGKPNPVEPKYLPSSCREENPL